MTTHAEDSAFRRELARRLRALRAARGLSQQQVAARAGVTRNLISAAERAAQDLDVIRLRRIAAALGVALPKLLDEHTGATRLALHPDRPPP